MADNETVGAEVEQLAQKPAITPAEVMKVLAQMATALAGVSKRLRSVEEVQEAMAAQLTGVLDVLAMHKTAIQTLDSAYKRLLERTGATGPAAKVVN